MKNMLTAIFVTTLALSVALSGCVASSENKASAGSSTAGNSTEQTSSAPQAADTGLKAGIVLGAGGLGDQSFNDLAYAGMQRAKTELGVDFDYVEPKQISDFELFLREMSADGGYEVIIAISFDQVDALTKVAAEFPDQKYGLIDGEVQLPNVASYVASEEQGSFLVGALAGLMKKDAAGNNLSDSQTIGFVGALDIPLINKFYAGYEAGARYVNPAIKVLGDYTGSFEDVTIAKEISNTMYSKGADIIYHAAGGCGIGVFQSAADNGFMAIGCNSNQNHIDPAHIVASMLKNVDTFAFEIVKSACVDSTYEGGKTVELDLAGDGVGYTLENSSIAVSPEIVEQITTIHEDIVSGKLVVPTGKDGLEDFLAKNKL